MSLQVAYIGNFDPPHSTENHVRAALLNNGHQVQPFQEHDQLNWRRLAERVGDFDFVLWTRTGWNPPIPDELQRHVLAQATAAGTPVIGFHLDRWWGLNRENQVRTEPFFRSDLVITADGGHQADFLAAGVKHAWLPPAVSRDECQREPRVRPEYQHPVLFVGSWREYHDEWSYRLKLVRWLQATYPERLGLYPKVGEEAVRGADLVDLYDNAWVIVGDSCLAGAATYYWSDRIPETLGRGGFLIHPDVVGLSDHFTAGEHLVTYPLGDFGRLQERIEFYLERPDEREHIRTAGQAHVLEHHTYERRMEQLLELAKEWELL